MPGWHDELQDKMWAFLPFWMSADGDDKKRVKCPECDRKNFNPIKILCEECRENSTFYKLEEQNLSIKHPNLYHE